MSVPPAPLSSPGCRCPQVAPMPTPSRDVCVCVNVYVFLINQQPFIRGISEETLAEKAAHTGSGLRILEGVT